MKWQLSSLEWIPQKPVKTWWFKFLVRSNGLERYVQMMAMIMQMIQLARAWRLLFRSVSSPFRRLVSWSLSFSEWFKSRHWKGMREKIVFETFHAAEKIEIILHRDPPHITLNRSFFKLISAKILNSLACSVSRLS